MGQITEDLQHLVQTSLVVIPLDSVSNRPGAEATKGGTNRRCNAGREHTGYELVTLLGGFPQ